MILSSIFTTVNVSLNSMIDSAKYKYLIIELIAILIATPHLSAQGLQFLEIKYRLNNGLPILFLEKANSGFL